MPVDHDYVDLFEIFPELAESDVVLKKEILAHFGLLFSVFADLETGIQQCYTMWQLRNELGNGKIKSEQKWIERYDALEAKAIKATFGTLLRLVDGLDEIKPHMVNLRIMKDRRDYFAHHFFREENDKMHSNEAILHLLWRMNILREQVDALSKLISKIHGDILQALYPHKDVASEISVETALLKEEYLKNPPTRFGWETD
jgi:hypothetical protein